MSSIQTFWLSACSRLKLFPRLTKICSVKMICSKMVQIIRRPQQLSAIWWNNRRWGLSWLTDGPGSVPRFHIKEETDLCWSALHCTRYHHTKERCLNSAFLEYYLRAILLWYWCIQLSFSWFTEYPKVFHGSYQGEASTLMIEILYLQGTCHQPGYICQ